MSRRSIAPVALVAGASRGIGQAVARTLASAGYLVACLARGRDGLARLQAAIDPDAERTLLLPADVRVAEEVDAAVRATKDRWGRIDALVYTAAAGAVDGPRPRGPLAKLPESHWDLLHETNLKGAFLCVRAVTSLMEAQRAGHVVLLGSLAGQSPAPGEAAYASSKWGLRGLAQSLGEELRESGIAVTWVAPGAVDTSRFDAPTRDGDDPARRWAVPAQEIAAVVLETLQRDANTWVPEIIIRPLRGERAVEPEEAGGGDESAGEWIHTHRPPPPGVTDVPVQALEVYREAIARSFYLNVGHWCDLACPHCSLGDGERLFHPPARLFRVVRAAANHGLGKGLFIGGEPSLYPHLEEVMVYGRLHGVRTFGLLTNGSGLRDKARVRLLGRLGVDYWQLSWDDHRPDVLAELHGRKRRAEALHLALENLCALPRDHTIVLYHVIVRRNLEVLPEAMSFFADLRREHPRVSCVMGALVKPTGSARVNDEILFSVEEARPYFREALRVADDRGLPFWINHLPGCLLPELPHAHSAHNFDRVFLPASRTWRSADIEGRLTKGEACLSCALFEICAGYYRAYVERYGADVFRPTGRLVRGQPLPSDRLGPGAPPGGAGDGAPPGTTPVDGGGDGRTVAPASDAATALRDRIESLAELLAPGLPEGWTLDGCRIGEGEAPYTLVCAVRDARSDGEPFTVCVAPKSTGNRGFLETSQLVVWYDGHGLSAPQEALLRHLAGYFSSKGDALVSLLTRALPVAAAFRAP